jgi:hypothetical protein
VQPIVTQVSSRKENGCVRSLLASSYHNLPAPMIKTGASADAKGPLPTAVDILLVYVCLTL